MSNGNTDTVYNAKAARLASAISNILYNYGTSEDTSNHLFCRLTDLLGQLPDQELTQLLEGVQNGEQGRRNLLEELGTTD